MLWVVQWRNIVVHKTYHSSDIRPTTALNQAIRVVDRINLPVQAGSLSYIFNYNANATSNPSVGWGEISSVTLPSGAITSYSYEKDNANGNLIQSPHILRNRPASKTLTYNEDYDGATPTQRSDVWTYSATYAGLVETLVLDATINGPDGGVSRDFFSGDDGRTYKSERPDGSVLERFYQNNAPQGLLATQANAVNFFAKYEFTSLRNASGTLTKTAIKEFNYDKNGNITQLIDYDWVNYGSVPRASGNPTGVPAGAIAGRVSANTFYSPTPDASNTTTNDPDTYNKPTSPSLRNVVYSSEVRSGGGTVLSRTEASYDSQAYPQPPIKGNLTTQTVWDSFKGGALQPVSNPLTPSNSVSVTNVYSVSGNPTLTTDAWGFQTQMIYGGINGFTDLYPTETKAALGTSIERHSTMQYDFDTGQVTLATDADNNVSTRTSYDVFGRPLLVKAAEGIAGKETQTATEYNEVARRVIVRADLSATGDGKLVSIQHYDQLGRVRLSRQLEDKADDPMGTDETKGIKTQTRYRFDSLTNSSFVLSSNPYRSSMSSEAGNETTMGWSRTKSDNGRRVVEGQTFSGTTLPYPWGTSSSSTGTVVTGYDAEKITATDQAGKTRRSVMDGLGRLVQVIEDPNDLNYLTSYGYDALDDLTSVNQQQTSPAANQTRTFIYTSLKRLKSAQNPESGIINYTYDDNGNLKTKSDARLPAVVTNYFYDGLNRLTSRTYSDSTPPVTFYYDAQTLPYTPANFTRGKSAGMLVAVTYGSGGSTTGTYTGGYDELGRPAVSVQRTDTTDYQFDYVYNLAGAMTSETYPGTAGSNRRIVQTEYDKAGRIAGVKKDATNYYAGAASGGADAISYAAHGAISRMKLGNGLLDVTEFNSRLQPTFIKLGTTQDPKSVLQLGYEYTSGCQTGNNGNVMRQVITAPGLTLTQDYCYDALNRLSSASENSGANWSQTYGYDRYGNRWVSQSIGYTLDPDLCPTLQNQIDAATNRINKLVLTGFDYDGSGNQIKQRRSGLNETLAYDAENRMTTFNGGVGQYFYDGHGHRVKKIDGNGTTVFVYSAGGQLIAEYTTAPSVPPGGTSYLTSDHLGSTRVVTTGGPSPTVKARYDYLPFGELIPSTIGGRGAVTGYVPADSTRQKFTGYERDTEADLDYAQARYYSSAQGRFTTFDPLIASAKSVEPQSWNRYSYVINNPLKHTDPTGLDWWYRTGESTATPEWRDQDPGEGYARWTKISDYVYQDSSGLWWALNPQAQLAYVTDSSERAEEKFSEWTGAGGLISGTPAQRDWLGGFNEGISGLPFASRLNDLAGYDTTSRDYRGGVNTGVLAGAIAGGTGGVIRSLTSSSSAVKIAERAIAKGATSVEVNSAEEAAEVFMHKYQGGNGPGYRNTTGMTGNEVAE